MSAALLQPPGGNGGGLQHWTGARDLTVAQLPYSVPTSLVASHRPHGDADDRPVTAGEVAGAGAERRYLPVDGKAPALAEIHCVLPGGHRIRCHVVRKATGGIDNAIVRLEASHNNDVVAPWKSRSPKVALLSIASFSGRTSCW